MDVSLCFRIALCIAVLGGRVVWGYRASGAIETNDVLYTPGSVEFGFLENAKAYLNVDVQQQNLHLHLLMCNMDEQYALLATDPRATCGNILSGLAPCTLTQTFKDRLRLEYTVARYGYYYFSFMRCDQTTDVYQIYVDFTFLNPTNNHLTATLVPAPTMYQIMTYVWGALFLLWATNIIKFWQRRVILHYILACYPLFKAVYCGNAVRFYDYYAEVGTYKHSEWALHWSLYTAFQAVFYLSLMLLSRGYSLSQYTVREERPYLFGFVSVLCLMLIMKYMVAYNSVIYLLVSLALIMINVSILAYVFLALTQTQRRLETLMLSATNGNIGISRQSGLVQRYRAFIFFKGLLAGWLVLAVLAFFTDLMFFGATEDHWVNLMHTEFLVLILFCGIGYTFRHRLVNIFMEPFEDADHMHQVEGPGQNDPEDPHEESHDGDGEIEMQTLTRHQAANPRPTHRGIFAEEDGFHSSDEDEDRPPADTSIQSRYQPNRPYASSNGAIL
eukprot:TRINITY_DN4584_c0_g1_i4.p1 TRINITY_DN4584_c0_g1~~TRINITY_DN4584_c0_g1_i4.p1  ORF type:complete len:501 (+),score=88.93 TRINITY_DN4584_c0_g1_i4:49-1551(+)